MKIIEALKKIKDLNRKADDLVAKAQKYCADMDFESPAYPDQKAQINEWIHAHRDIIHEIGSLQYRIQFTNVSTRVTICLGNNDVTHTISEWISRRRQLADMEAKMWSALTDRNLRDSKIQMSNQIVDSKVRRYYDPVAKDKNLSLLQSEPSIIDGKLEIVNAITDLME